MDPVGAVLAAALALGYIAHRSTSEHVKVNDTTAELTNTVDGISANVGAVQDTAAELTKTLDGISANVGAVQESVEKLKGDYAVLANQVAEILAKSDKRHGFPTYAIGATLLSSLIFAHMYYKGISASDVANGTRRGVANVLSSITKSIGKKSATATEKLKVLTEQIENFGKCDEQELLFNTLMEGRHVFDAELLGKAFDHLSQDPVAAGDFISKSRNTRNTWLVDFARRNAQKKIED